MNNIKQIEVIYDNRLVGRLALTKEGLCAFEYSVEWLDSGFSISPFELPLKSGVFIAKPRPFEGGFGVFDDCLPDGWGLLILDRYLQQKGVNPRTLTLLDRLALVGSTGRGALEFRPDKSVITRQDYVDFEKLALEAEQILDSDDYTGEGIEEFQDRGGSPGGARPKIFVRYDNKEWLVKFRAKRDPQSIGIDEYRYSVVNNDTLVENPIITDYIVEVLDCIRIAAIEQKLPINVQITVPKLEDSFWISFLGKGYPVPNNTFRWCTDRLKIKPTTQFILDKVDAMGEAIVLIGT